MINLCKLWDDLRIVWLRHVWWTREVIMGIAFGLPSLNDSVNKLLENPKEMADIFKPFITNAQYIQMIALFKQHLSTGGDIVTAAKAGDTAKVNQLQKEWHQNSDEIAKLMAGFGLNYNEAVVRDMMYTHLALTTTEATQILAGQYADAIKTFDKIQEEALQMADYFYAGIAKSLSV